MGTQMLCVAWSDAKMLEPNHFQACLDIPVKLQCGHSIKPTPSQSFFPTTTSRPASCVNSQANKSTHPGLLCLCIPTITYRDEEKPDASVAKC